MHSAKINQCFDDEEQEFLKEVVDPNVAAASQALQMHRDEETNVEDYESDLAIVDRQRRKLAFLKQLQLALEVD